MDSQPTSADRSAIQQKEGAESQFGQHPLESGGMSSTPPSAPPLAPPPLNLGGDNPMQRNTNPTPPADTGGLESSGQSGQAEMIFSEYGPDAMYKSPFTGHSDPPPAFGPGDNGWNAPQASMRQGYADNPMFNPGMGAGGGFAARFGGLGGGIPGSPFGGFAGPKMARGGGNPLQPSGSPIRTGTPVNLQLSGGSDTQLGGMVQNLGKLPHQSLVQGFMGANEQFVQARDADRESAKQVFPQVPQPVGLNPADGDAPSPNAITPTSNEPGAPQLTSKLTHYANNPPVQRVGSNKQNLGDGNGDVELSAGDREVVRLEGDIHPDQINSKVTSKRNELLPDYRNSKTEIGTDFGEGDIFPEPVDATLEGVAEFTDMEALGLPPMQATLESFTMAEAMDDQVKARFAPLLAEETAARNAYNAGLETEKASGEAEIQSVIADMKATQQEHKDQTIAEIAGFKADWLSESDQELLNFDGQALSAKNSVDSKIQQQLDSANSQISSAYINAENEAAGEYNKKVNEHGSPVQGRLKEGVPLQAQMKDGAPIQAFGRRIKKFFKKVVNTFVGWARGIVDGIKNFVQGVWNRLKNTVKGIVDKAKKAISGFVNNLTETLTNLVNDIRKKFAEIKDRFVNAINSAISNLKQTFTDLVNSVKNIVQNALDAISSAIVSLVNDFKDKIVSALKKMGQVLLELVLIAGTAALRLLLKMAGVGDPDAVINELVRFMGVIAKIIQNPVGFAKNLIQTIKQTFTNYFKNIGENMSEIFTTWFFGNPDLELPKDFSTESWMNFALDAAGVSGDSISEMMSADVNLPGGITIDPVAPVEALVKGGPDAMWGNLKGQLNAFPVVNVATSAAGMAMGGGDSETEVSDEEIKGEVAQMDFQTFLAAASEFLPPEAVEDLHKASGYYQQLVSGNIGGLIKDMGEELKDQLFNIPQMMKDMAIDWIMQDLLPQLPLLVATLVNPAGGLAKAVKAIYDGIMWCIENKEAIFRVIKTIYDAFNMIASGDIAGAEAMITTGINQSIGLLLDLLMEVVVSSSPSKKFGKMLENVSEKAEKAFRKVLDKIKGALMKFLETIGKVLGVKKDQKKKDKTNKKGQDRSTPKASEDADNSDDVELDYKGDPIPGEKDIAAAINRMGARVLSHAPMAFELPDYGKSYALRKKTYKVLQGLLDAYKKDDAHIEGGAISKKDAQSVAAGIDRRHPVFKWFKVVDDDQSVTGIDKKLDPEDEYWLYQWSASPTMEAIIAEQSGSALEGPGAEEVRNKLMFVIRDLQRIRDRGYLREGIPVPQAGEELAETLVPFFMMFTHNASHRPGKGDQSQVSSIERAKPLYYFRSQSNLTHPHERFYVNALEFLRNEYGDGEGKVTINGEAINLGSKSNNKPLLPSNTSPVDTANSALPGTQTVSGVGVTSVPVAQNGEQIGSVNTSQGTYNGPKAAHFGMRRTNPEAYRQGIELLFKGGMGQFRTGVDNIINFMKDHFLGKGDGKLTSQGAREKARAQVDANLDLIASKEAELNAEAKREYRELWNAGRPGQELHNAAYADGTETDSSLDTENIEYKKDFGNALAEVLRGANFGYLRVFTDKRNPNVQIMPTRPRYSTGTYSTGEDYHTVGYIGAVMSYLGGLLNKNGRGMGIVVNRRQSFGFMRPTLTDTAASIRFSLGTQPPEYAQVIFRSLKQLDRQLGSASHAQIWSAFEIFKSGKGQTRLTQYFSAPAKEAGAFGLAEGATSFGEFIAFCSGQVTMGGNPNPDAGVQSHFNEQNGKQDPAIGEDQLDEAQAQQDFNQAFGHQQDMPMAEKTLRRTLRSVINTLNRMHENGITDAMINRSSGGAKSMVDLGDNVKAAVLLLEENRPTTNEAIGKRYAKATYLTENIIENLALVQSAYPEGKSNINPEAEFKRMFTAQMGTNAGQTFVYRMDSGEQAGSIAAFASLARARGDQGSTKGKKNQRISGVDPYFELDSNITGDVPSVSLDEHWDTAKKKKDYENQTEAVRMIDPAPVITESDQAGVLRDNGNPLTNSLNTGQKVPGSLNGQDEAQRTDLAQTQGKFTMVIDVTNIGFTSNLVREAIRDWESKDNSNLSLILFASLLKHEQLGTDKVQAGRIVLLSRTGEAGFASLQSANTAAQNGMVKDYLNILAEISYGDPVRTDNSNEDQDMSDDQKPRSKKRTSPEPYDDPNRMEEELNEATGGAHQVVKRPRAN